MNAPPSSAALSEPSVSTRLRHELKLLCLAAMAAGVAWLSIILTRETERTAAIWPLNAVFLVLLMRSPRRDWPGLLAAMFVGNTAAYVVFGDPVIRAVMFVCANLVEVLVVAMAMTWHRSVRLLRRASIVRFAMAALVGCGISTVIVLSVLEASGTGLPGREAAVWLKAHLLGLLINVPILWILMSPSPPPGPIVKFRSMAPELALVAGTTAVVFAQSRFPLLFLVPPALVLLAIRRGLSGATVGMVAVALISVGFTLAERGPTMLVQEDAQIRMLVLQVFLASNALLALTVGATSTERDALIARLKAAKRRQAERSARERLMIKQAQLAERIGQVGYWTVRAATGETYWSPEVYRIYGVAPDTFNPALEDGLSPFVSDDQDTVQRVIRTSMETRSPWLFEANLRQPSGQIVRVRSVGEFLLTPEGDVDTVFGVIKDITEDYRLLEQVREKETLYRLLADNSSDLIARYGRDSVFTYLSPSVEAILGYRPEELVGRTTAALIHPDDLEQVYETWRVGLESGQPFSVQYRAIHRNGSIRWMEARPTVSRDQDGTIIDYIDTIRDISDRHEREMALAQAIATAQSASRAKADFLSNMSHEIRTPLNGVLGFADLLSREDLSDGQRHYARRIQSSARALLSIVNDILDFSKIEAGMMTVQARPFAPDVLVEEVIELVRAAYPDAGLAIVTTGRSTVRRLYMGDDDRIRQILLNLVGNAAKFTRRGRVEVKWQVRKGRLCFVVADSGPGIPADRLETIFDSFSQGDASISRSFGGSGLGLSISRSLARLMEGDLTLTSRVGHGTRVTLDLPAVPARETLPVETAARSACPARRGARILVVDDVDINRELIEIGLGMAGHSVTGVESGEAALAALRQGDDYDLILMDVQMPEMDGMAATRAIRALGGSAARIPVIGLSANVLPEQVAACRAAGMDDHLGKPVDMDRLIALIDERLDVTSTPYSGPPATDPAFAALRSRYLAQLAGVPAEMKALMAGSDASERAASLAALTHRIAGTAGSLGFTGVSEAAAHIAQTARAGVGPGTLQPLIEALVDQIRAVAASDAGAAPT